MHRRLPRDETALVRLAASCHDGAFCALRDRYSDLLTRIAKKYSAQAVQREDFEAEIVARLLRDRKDLLRKWEPVAPFAAYLTTIATRYCQAQIAKDKRRATTPLGTLRDGVGESTTDALERLIPADDFDQPGSALDRAEAKRLVRFAIATLSDRQQLILAMRFKDGMDGPAMAATLGISHGAVRQRLLTALRKLEAALIEQTPDVFS